MEYLVVSGGGDDIKAQPGLNCAFTQEFGSEGKSHEEIIYARVLKLHDERKDKQYKKSQMGKI